MSWLIRLGTAVLGSLTGGALDRILQTIEKRMDDEVSKEEVKAEVTKTWINAQSQLLMNRTWWYQLLFLLPLSLWFWAVILDSVFRFQWNVAALPKPLDEWAGWMVSAVFVVNSGKELIGRFRS